MQVLVDALQTKVSAWRRDGYSGVYPESVRLLNYVRTRAYLHEPQMEALETYVYLKEVLVNGQVSGIARTLFGNDRALLDALGVPPQEQLDIFAGSEAEKNKLLESKIIERFGNFPYPNYVFALTMGAGKTILMGALLMYEFLISSRYPQDHKFAKNVLVFGPADTGILDVLKEIKTFDYSKVLPKEYEDVLLNVKYWYLENTDSPLTPTGNYNVIVSNSAKIILRNFKETYNGNALMQLRRSAVNKRLEKIVRMEDLAVFVDEAHHSYGKDLDRALNQSRQTLNFIAEKTSVRTVVNLTGTPYVNNRMMPDTVYTFGLKQGIERGILKKVKILNHGDVQSEEFVQTVVDQFVEHYNTHRLEGRLPKVAFYAPNIDKLEEELSKQLDAALRSHKIPLHKKLIYHSGLSSKEAEAAKYEFDQLDTPYSEKQFILLVGRGTEGWNCKSLVACALYRNPNSTNFVLQASCRCLRAIGDNSTIARVFLSNENYKVLDNELKQNFGLRIGDLSDHNRQAMPYDLIVEKKKTLTVKKKYKNILASHVTQPENIKVSLKLPAGKIKEQLVQEREIVLENGRAVYKDPVAINSEKTVVRGREFGYYDVIGILQRKTHLSYAELSQILHANKIRPHNLTSAVQNEYALIQWIAEQILDKYISYTATEEIVEETIELTKAYPFKINLADKHKQELVVYREKEIEERGTSKLGFHINPYNFDSQDELQIFRYLRQALDKDEHVNDVYFTGGVPYAEHNEFFFEYANPEKEGTISRYFPDFLVETSKGRFLVVEIKGDDEKHAYNTEKARLQSGQVTSVENTILAKELGFTEFQQLNKNFEYHIIFNGTMETHKQELVQLIQKL